MRFALAVLAFAAFPLAAQEPAPDVYGPVDVKAPAKCPERKPGDEIVVCGEGTDSDRYRVQSSGDLDPTGKGAQGPPRAPDLYNLPQPAMVGVGVSAKGCFIPPCPKPMARIVDLSAIPDAPPGSDADRVGRGLAPTGRDDRPIVPDLPPPVAPAEAVRPPGSPAPAEVRSD